MSFDYKKALKDGYTVKEIADYLGQNTQIDISFMRKKGIKDGRIVEVLSATKPLQPQPKEEPQGYFSRVGSQYKQSAEDIISSVKRPSESEGSLLSKVAQIGEAGLRTAGSVARSAMAPITEALSPAIKPLIEKIATIPGIEKGISQVVDWAEKNPETAKDLGAVLDIATLGVGKLGEPLLKGTLKTGIKTTEKITEATGRGLKTAGEKAYSIAVPMEQSTARSVQLYQASKPTLFDRINNLLAGKKVSPLTPPIKEAETAARQGLVGTQWQLGVQAKKASENIWNRVIGPTLKSSKEQNDMGKFFSDLRNKIIAENPDLSRRNLLLKAWESMKRDYGKVNFVSDSKLQDYKAGWTKFISEKVYQGKPIAGALNDVRNMAANQAREIIYGKLGPAIKQAYIDYGNLQSIVEAGIKSIDPLRQKSAFRQMWEFILDTAITPISTIGGKTLYRTGQGLELIGEKGLKNIRELISK